MQPQSNWSYPPPRKGVAGYWDRFIGPGASGTEQMLILASSALAALAVVYFARTGRWGWSLGQYLIAALLALDIVGGIVTNATSSAKRWYHREGQGFWQKFGFVALHVLHIFLVAWLFRGFDVVFLVAFSLLLLASALVVLAVPLYVQRSVALLHVCVAMFVSLYLFSPTKGLEWFIPFLFIKLLVSHLTTEEPYARK